MYRTLLCLSAACCTMAVDQPSVTLGEVDSRLQVIEASMTAMQKTIDRNAELQARIKALEDTITAKDHMIERMRKRSDELNKIAQVTRGVAGQLNVSLKKAEDDLAAHTKQIEAAPVSGFVTKAAPVNKAHQSLVIVRTDDKRPLPERTTILILREDRYIGSARSERRIGETMACIVDPLSLADGVGAVQAGDRFVSLPPSEPKQTKPAPLERVEQGTDGF